jgi:uncharacterized protein involved in outer membrane biogenesis
VGGAIARRCPTLRRKRTGRIDTTGRRLAERHVEQQHRGVLGAVVLFGAPRLQGEVRLQAGSMAVVGDVLGTTLPRTRAFDLRGELRDARGVWQLREVRASVGDSRLGGRFRYGTRPAPPMLSGRLTGSRLLLSDMGPAVGVTAAPPEGKPAQPRRLLPEHRFELPKLGRMDADVRIQLDELGFAGAQLRPLQDLSAHLTLSGSVLRLDALQARVGGGRFWGSTRLDGHGAPAVWAADLRFAERPARPADSRRRGAHERGRARQP